MSSVKCKVMGKGIIYKKKNNSESQIVMGSKNVRLLASRFRVL